MGNPYDAWITGASLTCFFLLITSAFNTLPQSRAFKFFLKNIAKANHFLHSKTNVDKALYPSHFNMRILGIDILLP